MRLRNLSIKKEGQYMNLDEYKEHILAQREATKMSALSAIISSTEKKEGNR